MVINDFECIASQWLISGFQKLLNNDEIEQISQQIIKLIQIAVMILLPGETGCWVSLDIILLCFSTAVIGCDFYCQLVLLTKLNAVIEREV